MNPMTHQLVLVGLLAVCTVWNGLADVVNVPARIYGHGTLAYMGESADGQRIVTGGSQGAFIWNAETGALIREFAGYHASPRSTMLHAALSPDGASLVALSQMWNGPEAPTDHLVTLWRVDSGERVHQFPVKATLWRVGFSPNGARFLAMGEGMAIMWTSDGAQELAEVYWPSDFSYHGGNNLYFAFSPDGDSFVAGTAWDPRTCSGPRPAHVDIRPTVHSRGRR
jgi:WD40 repeat protein